MAITDDYQLASLSPRHLLVWAAGSALLGPLFLLALYFYTAPSSLKVGATVFWHSGQVINERA